MREIDEATDAESAPESPAPYGELPPLADELELAVIEGLAAEDTETVTPVVPSEFLLKGAGAAAVPTEAAVVLNAVQGLGEQLSRRLDALRTMFDRELRAESTRERVIDRLHAELQEYKQDLLLKVQRPIFIDLIQLHDDIGKMIGAPPGPAEAERPAALQSLLQSIQIAIEDILYRQGVEPFAREGNDFDPRTQRAASTVATDDPG